MYASALIRSLIIPALRRKPADGRFRSGEGPIAFPRAARSGAELIVSLVFPRDNDPVRSETSLLRAFQQAGNAISAIPKGWETRRDPLDTVLEVHNSHEKESSAPAALIASLSLSLKRDERKQKRTIAG